MDHGEARAVLLKAWAAWDARPGDEHRAKAMEAACKQYAAYVNVSSLELRMKLAGFRREALVSDYPMTYEACVDAARLEFELENEEKGSAIATDGL